MKLKEKLLTYRSPKHGTAAYETSYYTKPTGLDRVRVRRLEISDDIFDNYQRSFSTDNGRTWPESQPMIVAQRTPLGTVRGHDDAVFLDPTNGRLLQTCLEGLFQRDVAAEGFTAYYLKYRVSEDGGRTWLMDERVVQNGFTPEHPFADVWIGKNAFLNAAPNSIVRAPAGHLVAAAPTTVVDADGKPHNPGGGYGWFEILILSGRWQSDARLEWESRHRLKLGPHQSTRGICEPTLALMPDGRILLVARGSNGYGVDPEGKLPSHKWHCVSADGGFTWTEPQPWRFTDGTAFYSPSSISELMWHSNGKLYWFGNISDKNCFGDTPRHPLFVGEVDSHRLMLNSETLFIIDDRQPDDPPIQLSNFYAYEDRVTGDILLQMTRYVEQSPGVWGGDAHLYRITV